MGLERLAARNEEICALFKSGIPITVLGVLYRCTRQNICHILKTNGLRRWDGGMHVSRSIRRSSKQAIREANRESYIRDHFGCSISEWRELRSLAVNYKECPVYFYKVQKFNAERRGIEWELTLTEWWAIWLNSGKWEQRGTFSGQYVMARHEDQGPYAVNNVKIVSTLENHQEYYALYGEEHKQLIRAGRGLT